jgi:predicted lysophospholipase L1 biosynthesis ABC-type transport system permease subunit
MFRQTRAQSVLEYAVIVSVAVAALLAMNIYMKRASEGKLRESSDRLGQQFDMEAISNIHSKNTRNVTNVQETGIAGAGVTVSRMDSPEVSQSTSNETIGP